MIAEIAVMLCGFISFPIFTRFLTKTDYGVMNVISVTLRLVILFSSIGLPPASQRFFSEYKTQGVTEEFYSTTIISSVFLGLMGAFVTIFFCRFLSFFEILPANIGSIAFFAALLVPLRSVMGSYSIIFRVTFRPKVYSLFSIFTVYAGAAAAIALVVWLLWGIFGYYFGMAIGESIILAICCIYASKSVVISFRKYSFSILKELSLFGFPIAIASFGGTLLSVGDRYLIGYFMTPADVAFYSVPYNLCIYIASSLILSFQFAFLPLIMDKWDSSDRNAVSQNVESVIAIFCLLAFPIIFGLTSVGEDILVKLASNKYSGAGYLIPYIIIGEMSRGLITPMMIGFQLKRRTSRLIPLTWSAAILNCLMNIFLLPILGLKGAAISTTFCNLMFLAVGSMESSKEFKVGIPWRKISIYCFSAILMYSLLRTVDSYSPVSRPFEKIVLGVVTYSIAVFSFDANIRRKCLSYGKILTKEYLRKIS